MKMSEGVEWAVHCCTVLAHLPAGLGLPAARLAEFHGVPPTYLAKQLQQLSAAGIVTSSRGRRGGYRLARSPADVSLLDIVLAVDGAEPAFRCSEIRRRGPSQVEDRLYSPVCGIAAAMWRAESAWRKELSAVTVASLIGGMAADVPIDAVRKGAAWLQEVLR